MGKSKVQSVEEFKERLYALTLKLLEFIDKLPKDFISKQLGDKLLHSGTGIMSYYTNAAASAGKIDSANCLNHALKSANESKLWLCLLRDSKRARPKETEWFILELHEICSLLASSILALKSKN